MSKNWGFGGFCVFWWSFVIVPSHMIHFQNYWDLGSTLQVFWGFLVTIRIIKNVSYVGVQWQKPHQDTQNPQKSQFLDIPELPDILDGDQISKKPFLYIRNVSRIPKMYYMWGFNEKSPSRYPTSSKTQDLLTFLSFLIILIVIKNSEKSSWVILGF